MPIDAGNIFVILVLLLWLVIFIVIGIRMFKSKYGPVKTVKATVVDKSKIETFSKYFGNSKRNKFVIVFETDGKKLSFYVSQFSYGGYKIKETGTLKYCGDRIIDFS